MYSSDRIMYFSFASMHSYFPLSPETNIPILVSAITSIFGIRLKTHREWISYLIPYFFAIVFCKLTTHMNNYDILGGFKWEITFTQCNKLFSGPNLLPCKIIVSCGPLIMTYCRQFFKHCYQQFFRSNWWAPGHN